MRKSITTHLEALLEYFNRYLPEETAPEKCNSLRSPFTENHKKSDHLTRTWRTHQAEVWISLARENPTAIHDHYGCTDAVWPHPLIPRLFSALTCIKNKYIL